MLHRKLLEVLSRLTPVEHRQLRLFLESPYFTQGFNGPQILALYDIIMQYKSDENHPELCKEVVFPKLFPKLVFKEKEKSPLDSLSSDLFRLVRQYFFQRYYEVEKDNAASYLSLMQFYRKNGLEERFWQTVSTVRKMQDSNKLRGVQYFLDQFHIEEEISNFQGTFNTHEDDANLKNVHINLDNFYSILKLEYACALSHRQKTSQLSSLPSESLTIAILDIIDKESYLQTPLSKVYKIILEILKNGSTEESLNKLEYLLDAEQEKIPSDKFRDLLAYYRAFYTWSYVRSGSTQDLTKVFEMYNSHLIKGFLYLDNKLTPMALRVISNIGLKLHKYPWVKKLLDDHPPERICGTKYPVEAHSLNVAEYHFHKKEYDEAEAKLTYRAFENPNFSISADVLLIKIYFETGSELIESRMKALEQKVRRSKISAETKAGYYNFLKKLDKVIKYGWQKPSPKRDKLVEEIKTTPSVFAREWLLEKLH